MDSEDRITDSYTFSYIFSLNQDAARSANYVADNKITFSVHLSSNSTASKFTSLFSNEYITANIGAKYNSTEINNIKMTFANNYVSSSFDISNLTESAKEKMTVNLTFGYVTSSFTKIENYFESLPKNTDFSFKLNIEAFKNL